MGDGHSRNLEPSQLGNKGASATALSRERDLDCAGQEVVTGVHFLSISVFPGIQATVSLDNARSLHVCTTFSALQSSKAL